MSRRVATITLNPAYDLVGFCPEIERGEVNLVKTTGLHAAGKGINVAKVLKDLGIDVTVGGFLGKDNQDGFQQLFSELGIANRFQVVQGRTRINVKLTEKDGNPLEHTGISPRQVWINHDYHKSVEQEPYYGKSAWSSRSRNRLFSVSQSQSPLPDNANLLSHT